MRADDKVNRARSASEPPAAGAPFRDKVRAWAMLAAAVPVAAVSSLIGMAPNIVEDGQGNVIECGPALFHGDPRPSPLCDTVPDPWRLIAQVGLVLGACLVVAAMAFGIRSARGQPSQRPF